MKEYLKDIKSIGFLTHEEQEACYWAYKNNNDIEARNKLVVTALPIAIQWAKERFSRTVPFEDLVQAVNMALIAAVDSWDPNKGKYLTHAYWKARHYITKFYITEGSLIYLPQNLRFKPKTDFQTNCKTNYYERLSRHLVAPEEDPIDEKLDIKQYVHILKKRERDILLERLRGFTLKEIGERHNISRERVRQLEQKAITQIRYTFFICKKELTLNDLNFLYLPFRKIIKKRLRGNKTTSIALSLKISEHKVLDYEERAIYILQERFGEFEC